MRLDQAVAARYPEISRRKARELIAARRVLVNDRPVGIASREIADSDRLAIVDELPELAVLRETDDWVAIDKPAGRTTITLEPVEQSAPAEKQAEESAKVGKATDTLAYVGRWANVGHYSLCS